MYKADLVSIVSITRDPIGIRDIVDHMVISTLHLAWLFFHIVSSVFSVLFVVVSSLRLAWRRLVRSR